MTDPLRMSTSRRAALGALFAVTPPGVVSAAAPQIATTGQRWQFDIRNFGAIGDGRSHPLAERYGGLIAAKRDFPKAASLQQEIDGCALQAAIDAAEKAGGGDVRAGTGTFILDRPVWFPEAGIGFGEGPAQGVSLFGAGQGATVFQALKDFPGYMLDCLNRFTTRWGSQGVWQDFTLRGPGADPGWGNFNCALSGLGWGAHRAVSRVSVQDCRIGMSMTGDQSMIDRFVALACSYGIYFDKPNPGLFGDQLFAKVILDRCWRAAVGVHPDASIPKSRWDTPIFAATPFGIYKEMGGSTNFVMRAVEMSHAQFENIGIAAISGGSVSGSQGSARPDVQNVRLSMPQIGPWDDARLISGWKRSAMLDLHQIHQGFVVNGINEPNLWQPGELALICITLPNALSISGDIDALLAACEEAKRPIISMEHYADDIVLDHPGRWSGRIYKAHADTPITTGDILVHHDGTVRRSAGNPQEVVAGVCMLPPTGPYGPVVVADQGQVVVKVGSANINNVRLRASVDGRADPEGKGATVGLAYFAGAGMARLRLQGIR